MSDKELIEPVDENKETPKKTTKKETPVQKEAEIEININTFIERENLPWPTRVRLEKYVKDNSLNKDFTIKEWQKILKKI